MIFWQVFLVLSVLAALFVVWPTLFLYRKHKRGLQTGTHNKANALVFDDHLQDLAETHARGELVESEFESLKEDLESTLVAENAIDEHLSDNPIVANFRSRMLLLVLVFALPLLAYLLYLRLGAAADWEIHQLHAARMNGSQEQRKASGQALIHSLQARLQTRPSNVQNWYLLASTAIEQMNYDEAVRAYRALLDLQPKAPKIMAELAQALFLRAGNTITPEVREKTQKALALNAQMPTALGLAGIDAFQSGDYTLAITHWENAIASLDPRSAAYQALTQGTKRAKAALKKQGKAGGSVAAKAKGGAGESLSVWVRLNKREVDVKPEDTVFVYARAWQGPKMPLAIQKLTVADLPKKITLDKSMAMAPGMDLSRFPQIELVARISPSGGAIPQPGDWQASIGPVILAEANAKLTLRHFKLLP